MGGLDGKTPQQHSNEDKGLEPPTAKDEDPEGLKALAGEGTPVLEQAWKLLQPLLEVGLEENVEVWLAVYDVAIRRGRYLQAVGALERAKKAGGEEHPEVHVRVVDLKQRGVSRTYRAEHDTEWAGVHFIAL
jgi:peptide alpha-N-acetyltransferase